MYYIEPKDFDTIEIQNAKTETEIIKYAQFVSDDEINNIKDAIKSLSKHGYVVFSDV